MRRVFAERSASSADGLSARPAGENSKESIKKKGINRALQLGIVQRLGQHLSAEKYSAVVSRAA